VTRVYDFGRDGGVPYLVMELLEGDTLADRLAGGPLPPSESARICAAVADALDAAHSRGIIHRDIKPSNVLLTPAGEVKVMDFGIARRPMRPIRPPAVGCMGPPHISRRSEPPGRRPRRQPTSIRLARSCMNC